MGCVLASFSSSVGFGADLFNQLEQRRRNAGHLYGAIAAEGAGSAKKAGALARTNRQLGFLAAIQSNDVVFTNVQQFAERDGRAAKLDGDRQRRPAEGLEWPIAESARESV